MAKPKLPLEPKIMKHLLDAIKMGMTLKSSIGLIGLPESTFYLWIAKGEKAKNGKYSEFMESISRAKQEGKFSRLKSINKHGLDDWRATAWILERTCPEEFAKREYVGLQEREDFLPVDISDKSIQGSINDLTRKISDKKKGDV